MTTITPKQSAILMAMRSGCDTPTGIGLACGKGEQRASQWACDGLKSLESAGLVEGVGKCGSGRAGYALTDQGKAVVEDLITNNK